MHDGSLFVLTLLTNMTTALKQPQNHLESESESQSPSQSQTQSMVLRHDHYTNLNTNLNVNHNQNQYHYHHPSLYALINVLVAVLHYESQGFMHIIVETDRQLSGNLQTEVGVGGNKGDSGNSGDLNDNGDME